MFGRVIRVLAAGALAGAFACSAFGFDRPPVSVAGLKADGWGQSTTTAERLLKDRFHGITVVYCAGITIPGDSSDSSWVHGLTRFWDKLACAGRTATTGRTVFVVIFDAKGKSSWIIYRLKGVSLAALKTP